MQCVETTLLSQVCRSAALEQESSFKHLNLTYYTALIAPVAQKGVHFHTVSAGPPQSLQRGLSCDRSQKDLRKWEWQMLQFSPRQWQIVLAYLLTGNQGSCQPLGRKDPEENLQLLSMLWDLCPARILEHLLTLSGCLLTMQAFLLTILHIKPIVLGRKNSRDSYSLADFLQQFFLFETSFLQRPF